MPPPTALGRIFVVWHFACPTNLWDSCYILSSCSVICLPSAQNMFNIACSILQIKTPDSQSAKWFACWGRKPFGLDREQASGVVSGSLNHLQQFETERQRVVVPMMASFDGLNRLYSNRNPLLVLFRTLGCQTLQTLSPVKVGHFYIEFQRHFLHSFPNLEGQPMPNFSLLFIHSTIPQYASIRF